MRRVCLGRAEGRSMRRRDDDAMILRPARTLGHLSGLASR